jgi:glutathione S-transferase
LSARDFLACAAPTIADISCCGYLFWVDHAGVDLASWLSIGAWLERIRSLPRWQAPYDLLIASPPIASGTLT